MRWGRPEDADAIQRAYVDHHPNVMEAAAWRWPEASRCLVAECGGAVVAFAAVSEQPPLGVVIHELWQLSTRQGAKGLAALATALLDYARRENVRIGGYVANDNARHAAALSARGFRARAQLWVWDPAEHEQQQSEAV